MKINK